jgi:hypothetical protein
MNGEVAAQVEIDDFGLLLPGPGRKLRFSGFDFPTPAQPEKAGVASALYAEGNEAHGAIA